MHSCSDNDGLLLFVVIQVLVHERCGLHALSSEDTSTLYSPLIINVWDLRQATVRILIIWLPLSINIVFLPCLVNIELLFEHGPSSIRLFEKLLLILRRQVRFNILCNGNNIAGISSECVTQIIHPHNCLGVFLLWVPLGRFVLKSFKCVF